MRAIVVAIVVALVAALVAMLTPVGVDPAGAGTERVTTPVSSAATRTRTSFSFRPWLSADGRYVAFDSDAAGLVADDTNGQRDIFVHDRRDRSTSRVSVGLDDAESDGESQRPTLSADGRYVAFWSVATNLVAGDTNGVADAFLYDRETSLTRRVSVASDGTEANAASARPVVSADGRSVAFESSASNLLPPVGLLEESADQNKVRDTFVHDVASGETTRVSVTSDGAEGDTDHVRPTISGDGSLVAFHTESALSPDDTNGARDVYLHDRTSLKTTRVSISGSGGEGNAGSFSPTLSADGRYLAFWSNARNLVGEDDNKVSDIFVRDLLKGATTRVSTGPEGMGGDGPSSDPAISPNGRYVTFWSQAANLVEDDTNGARDVFVHDRASGETSRVSVSSDGTESDADSYSPNISADGAVVAFDSEATTLSPSDTNKGSDIFVSTRDSSGAVDEGA